MSALIRANARVSSVGQITLPSAMRKRFGIEMGDEVSLVADDKMISIQKPETLEENVKRVSAELEELRQSFPDDVKERIKKYAGWTVTQIREYHDNLPETREALRKKYGL